MNLKTMREAVNITQAELAKTLGLKQSSVAMWETGKSVPKTTDLPKLAKVLNVSVEEIINCFKIKRAASNRVDG